MTNETLLLLDSGGQYICGTTDITRCIHLGTPTPKHKLAYTRVLQVGVAWRAIMSPKVGRHREVAAERSPAHRHRYRLAASSTVPPSPMTVSLSRVISPSTWLFSPRAPLGECGQNEQMVDTSLRLHYISHQLCDRRHPAVF